MEDFAGGRIRCRFCHADNIVPRPTPVSAAAGMAATSPAGSAGASAQLAAAAVSVGHSGDMQQSNQAGQPDQVEGSADSGGFVAPLHWRRCLGCGTAMPPEAQACSQCGRETHTVGLAGPRRMKQGQVDSVSGGAWFIKGLIAGLVAAVLTGGLWAGICIVTNYEFGWIAWIIGVIVGVAVAKGAGEQSPSTGLVAVAMAITALIMGKAMLFGYITQDFGLNTAADKDLAKMSIAVYMYENGIFDQETARMLETTTPESYRFKGFDKRIDTAIEQYMDRLTPDRKKEIVARYRKQVFSQIPMKEGIAAMFSPFDILWFLLALGSAYKIGAGSSSG